jgi:hypothetical protein
MSYIAVSFKSSEGYSSRENPTANRQTNLRPMGVTMGANLRNELFNRAVSNREITSVGEHLVKAENSAQFFFDWTHMMRWRGK